ncbi:beta-galactosidase [Candidatus Bathyarchaeota archaeon]|nr:beta-galactosidase [Candidatus Bathyarchaeota archaeon]
MKCFRTFPFGVTYQHWRDPSITGDEWDRDFRTISEYKLNHVWLAVHWAKVEKTPGRYDFSEIDYMVELAKKYGLKVHLVLEGYRGGEEGPPPTWLLRKHRDVYVEEGIDWGETEAKRICPNHPAVKEGIRRFFEAVAEHFRDEDAILLYNIYWEPNFVCRCKYTMMEYVKWLKRKYGTIERLREVWMSPNIEDWEDIVEFKHRIGLGFPYATPILDWRAFCLYNVANIIREGAETLKSKDPNHPVLCHPVLSMVNSGYSVSVGVDDWLIARSVDILGTSFYPTIPMGRGPLKPAVDGWLWAEILDSLRSAAGEKPLFIAELQTHYRSRYHPLDRVSPSQLQMLCWLCIAHGAKGITMWKWRPFLRGLQLSGRGLTLYDGTPTGRAEAAKKVGEVLEKYSDIFLEMSPVKAEAAILFNPMAYIKLLHLSQKPGSVEYCVSDIGGFYKALWESHIPVDFIRPEDIEVGRLKGYKLLYMPFTICLDKSVAEKLFEFARNGGFIVADSPCAITDDFEVECYKVVPGAGLDKLFRCREVDLYAGLDSAPDPTPYRKKQAGSGIRIRTTVTHPALPNIEIGSTFSGSLYKEKLEVLPEGEVLGVFEDGSPAMIASSHGKGGAVFIGTCIGRSYLRYGEEGVRRLIAGFAKWAGVVKPVKLLELRGGPIDLTVHNYADDKILFAINLGTQTLVAKLGVRTTNEAFRCLSLLEDKEIPVEYEVGMLTFRTCIPPNGVGIYRISRR